MVSVIRGTAGVAPGSIPVVGSPQENISVWLTGLFHVTDW